MSDGSIERREAASPDPDGIAAVRRIIEDAEACGRTSVAIPVAAARALLNSRAELVLLAASVVKGRETRA